MVREIVEQLYKADLVIADLTDRNPNVFYELGIRHAFRKPCLQIVHKDTEIPFDVAQVRTVKYDHQNLTAADQAKVELIGAVMAVEKGERPSITPVTIAESVLSLRSEASSTDKMLGQMLELLSSQHSLIGDIRNRLLTERQGTGQGAVLAVKELLWHMLDRAGIEASILLLPWLNGEAWMLEKEGKSLAVLHLNRGQFRDLIVENLSGIVQKTEKKRALVVIEESGFGPVLLSRHGADIVIIDYETALRKAGKVLDFLAFDLSPKQLLQALSDQT